MKSKRFLAVATVLATLASLGLGGVAQALPVYYADLYTNNALPGALRNTHVEATLAADPGNLFSYMSAPGAQTLGLGLGSGYVGSSSPRTITHSFGVDGYSVSSIISADLYLMVTDDVDFSFESAIVDIDGVNWGSVEGSYITRLFNGDVTAEITRVGDSFDVHVIAAQGDFTVVASALVVSFEGRPVSAVPEPNAALVFGAGALLTGLATRRRGAS